MASVMPRVTARINKVYYGTSSVFPWLPFVPEMIDRPRVLGPSGDLMTPGGWSTIVAKVCFCHKWCLRFVSIDLRSGRED
jgi:hypothetical protein